MSNRALLGYLLALAATILAVIAALLLRAVDPPDPPAPKTREPYYDVKPGESLSAISERTGVPVDQLAELNPSIDPLALVPGQRLRLRDSVPLPVARARARAGPRVPEQAYYVVKPGDVLSSIAEKTDVPLDRLLKLNRGLRRDRVTPGQRIKLRPACAHRPRGECGLTKFAAGIPLL